MSDSSQEIKKDPRGGFRAGAGRPKGARNSRPRAPKHSDAIECSRIENLLADHYTGISELSPTQLKAIELRYSRLRPTLSAVEQTIVDPRDKQDPAELAAKLAAMFSTNPGLLEQVNAIRAAANQPAADEAHVTH